MFSSVFMIGLAIDDNHGEEGKEEHEEGEDVEKRIGVPDLRKYGKKVNKKRDDTIIMNVIDTKYEIVRHAGKNILSWKICRESSISKNWDIYWTDSAIRIEFLAKMEKYQRVNHFPGSQNS